MQLHKVKDKIELAGLATTIFKKQIQEKPDSVLGLATGTTPIDLYDNLVELNEQGIIDFSEIRTINLDEYRGMDPGHEQSYRYFMDRYLFSRINIKMENTYVPDGLKDEDEAVDDFNNLIESYNGADLQLLGIGINGHIAFLEPGESLPAKARIVDLDQSTINANSRLFNNKSEVPRKAISLGARGIMLAKKIVMLANKNKEGIIDQAFSGQITPHIPASILQLHSDVTVIMSQD